MTQNKKFAVIGLGRFGRSVAKTLHKNGVEVIAVDKDPDVVKEVGDSTGGAVAIDGTQKALLLDLGVGKVDAAVVGIGKSFEANVLVTSLLKGFGIETVVTRSYTELQDDILRSVGASSGCLM